MHVSHPLAFYFFFLGTVVATLVLLTYVFVEELRPPLLETRQMAMSMSGLLMGVAASGGALYVYERVGSGIKLWKAREHDAS